MEKGMLLALLILSIFLVSGINGCVKNNTQTNNGSLNITSKETAELVLSLSDFPENDSISYLSQVPTPRLKSDVDNEGILLGWQEGYYVRYAILVGENITHNLPGLIMTIEQYISKYPAESISKVLDVNTSTTYNIPSDYNYLNDTSIAKPFATLTYKEMPCSNIGDKCKSWNITRTEEFFSITRCNQTDCKTYYESYNQTYYEIEFIKMNVYESLTLAGIEEGTEYDYELLVNISKKAESKIYNFSISKENLTNREETNDQEEDQFSNVKEKHWKSMPVTYQIHNKTICDDYESSRIKMAFGQIENATDGLVYFSEVNSSADIDLYCFYNKKISSCIVLGKNETWWVGYFRNDAEITSQKSINETHEELCGTWYEQPTPLLGYAIPKFVENIIPHGEITFVKNDVGWSGCVNFPQKEIHEILHLFGFDHIILLLSTGGFYIRQDSLEHIEEDLKRVGSIMNPYMACAYQKGIDNETANCLKHIYSNGQIEGSCSSSFVYMYEYPLIVHHLL